MPELAPPPRRTQQADPECHNAADEEEAAGKDKADGALGIGTQDRQDEAGRHEDRGDRNAVPREPHGWAGQI